MGHPGRPAYRDPGGRFSKGSGVAMCRILRHLYVHQNTYNGQFLVTSVESIRWRQSHLPRVVTPCPPARPRLEFPRIFFRRHFMAAAPVLPASPMPAPESAPLSQGARIVNTFLAPSKTFADLNRSAAWWAPFLLMIVVSTIFVYTAGQKIGFRKIMENQMQAQPKQQERLEKLPADQREQQLEGGAKFTQIISYAFPVITLLIWLIIATALFVTFK